MIALTPLWASCERLDRAGGRVGSGTDVFLAMVDARAEAAQGSLHAHARTEARINLYTIDSKKSVLLPELMLRRFKRHESSKQEPAVFSQRTKAGALRPALLLVALMWCELKRASDPAALLKGHANALLDVVLIKR
jgi:hypothetical protein